MIAKNRTAISQFNSDLFNLKRSIEKADGVLVELYDRLISEFYSDNKGVVDSTYLRSCAGELRATLYNRCPAINRDISLN